MCEAKPGPRCASDTADSAQEALTDYESTHPNGPAVDPITGAEQTLGTSRPHQDKPQKAIDEELEALMSERATLQAKLESEVRSVRHALKHRQKGSTKRERNSLPYAGWPTSEQDALTQARIIVDQAPERAATAHREAVEQLATMDDPDSIEYSHTALTVEFGPHWTDAEQRMEESLTRLDTIETRSDDMAAQAMDLEAEFTQRGGWSRYFYVTSSPDGHIHSSLACSTCTPTTSFAWKTSLSGESEQGAVDQYGAVLCTVCYPSAPTGWTNGDGRINADGKPATPPTEFCPGSGQSPREGSRRGRYGACTQCDNVTTVGMGGLRKHKPA